MVILIITILLLGIAIVAYLFSNKFKEIEKYIRIGSFTVLSIICIILFFSSLTTIDSGTVVVLKVFGKYQKGYVTEGIHLLNPFASQEIINIQRNAIGVDDGDKVPGMNCTTKDNIQTDVQANFAFAINPEYAWWLRKNVGNETKVINELLEKAANSATRDAEANYSLEEAQIKKRTEFEKDLRSYFHKNIVLSLPRNRGLSEKELENVIVTYPTQLMEVTPDQKVANALSEKKATEIDLQRQVTLTAISKEAINRKQQEGQGIQKMFEALPKGYTAQDVALVLDASANKLRAEAFMKAVESGKVSSMVFEGSSARLKQ